MIARAYNILALAARNTIIFLPMHAKTSLHENDKYLSVPLGVVVVVNICVYQQFCIASLVKFPGVELQDHWYIVNGSP